MKYLKCGLSEILFFAIEAIFAVFIVDELFCGCSGSSELVLLLFPLIVQGVFCFSNRRCIKSKTIISVMLSLWVMYLMYSSMIVGKINISADNSFAQVLRLLSLAVIFLSPLITLGVHFALGKKDK